MQIASLHAGLIERARPAKEPIGILKLRAASAPPPKVAGPVEILQARIEEPSTAVAMPSRRRYGLTLRVEQDMRRQLAKFTDQTGRTLQSVLYAALSSYLVRANSVLQHKE
ncbi:MAG: hypothetical protein AAF557_23565 [Pseudomonadota bacterium]